MGSLYSEKFSVPFVLKYIFAPVVAHESVISVPLSTASPLFTDAVGARRPSAAALSVSL